MSDRPPDLDDRIGWTLALIITGVGLIGAIAGAVFAYWTGR